MAQYDLQYSHLLPSHLLMGQAYSQAPGSLVSPIHAQHQFQGYSSSPSSPISFTPNGSNSDPYNSIAAQYNISPYYPPMMDQLEAAGQTSRTVYLGNLPDDITAEQILDHVHSGIVESVKIFPEKNCAFISFLNHSCAAHFYSDAILRKLTLNSHELKVGWGKTSPLPAMVALAVSQNSATRNIYIGNLPEDITEAEIREDLSKFGPIDTVKLIREKNIGFVHFLSIGIAMKVVQQLTFEDPSTSPIHSKWSERKVFYGKDRCAYISKTQQQNAAQYLGIAPGYEHLLATADRDLISSALAQQSAAAVAVATAAGGAGNVGNRTLYLGSVHPETTIEEICNVVRGGLLHNIRYIPEKHICFITFVDPTAAAQFYALATLQGLAIHNRRLKIGWGKHSGPLPQGLAMAVTAGASRNVYIGNIDENWPESKLRHDFSEFGEIEQINFLPEKSCAFVNFTNLANAIKAIDGIKEKEEYQKFKVNFGKDRCANPSRQLQQPGMAQGPSHSPTGNGPSAAAAVALAAAAAAVMAPGGPLLSSSMNNNMANAPNQMNNMNNMQSAAYNQFFPQNLQMMDMMRRGHHGHNNSITISAGSSSRSSPGVLSPIEDPNINTSSSTATTGSGYRVPHFSNDTSTTITIPEEDEGEEEGENTPPAFTVAGPSGAAATSDKRKVSRSDGLEKRLFDAKVQAAEYNESPELSDDERTSVEEETTASALSSEKKKEEEDGQDEASILSANTSSSSAATVVTSTTTFEKGHKVVASRDYKVIDQATAAAAAAEAAQAFGL